MVLAKVDLLADVGRPLVTIIRMDMLLGGRYNQAIRQERKTIEIDPKRPNTYLVLGIVYLKEKQ